MMLCAIRSCENFFPVDICSQKNLRGSFPGSDAQLLEETKRYLSELTDDPQDKMLILSAPNFSTTRFSEHFFAAVDNAQESTIEMGLVC